MPVRMVELQPEPPLEPDPVQPDHRPDPVQRPPVDPGDDPVPDPVASPQIGFRSSPSGASVFVGGSLVGRTPFTWSSGSAGSSARVEYRLAGFQSTSFNVTVPQDGESATESHSLQPVAQEPGRVNVNVSRGWAYVYIDGKKLETTTPLTNHEVPAGTHTVRVVNEALDIDVSKNITVESGDSPERVFFKVD